jgi:negative modulator of initiation of replication
MKTIEVDEDLYRYIASQTQHIGESASDILRRLLNVGSIVSESVPVQASPAVAEQKSPSVSMEEAAPKQGLVVGKDAGQKHSVDGVKAMRSLLISDEFAASNKAIDRFMLVLSSLYQIDRESFSEAAQVKGRTRVYFADNEDVLLASGKTTKPRLIPNTPFWVITNNNTNRKRQMVDQLMTRMGFQADLIEKVCGSI